MREICQNRPTSKVAFLRETKSEQVPAPAPEQPGQSVRSWALEAGLRAHPGSSPLLAPEALRACRIEEALLQAQEGLGLHAPPPPWLSPSPLPLPSPSQRASEEPGASDLSPAPIEKWVLVTT